MNALDKFIEYHKQIGKVFMAPGATPFRISKEIWALYDGMNRWLIMNVAKLAVAADAQSVRVVDTAYCECGTCVAIRKQQGRG